MRYSLYGTWIQSELEANSTCVEEDQETGCDTWGKIQERDSLEGLNSSKNQGLYACYTMSLSLSYTLVKPEYILQLLKL